MTRHGGLLTALVHASTLVALLAAGAHLDAADYALDDDPTAFGAGPARNTRMTAANAPRAGSIARGGGMASSQRGVFEPPTEYPAEHATRAKSRTSSGLAASASRQAAFDEAAADNEYFDPRINGRTSRRHTSVHRAAYNQYPAAEGAIIEGAPTMPLASPEDLPTPSYAQPMPGIEPMPGIDRVPYGPLRYRRAPLGYGPEPAHGGDCGCDEGNDGESCGSCGDCDLCDTCDDWYPGKDLTLYAGVHGFKGPVDNGRNGNFGFQEGVNWSSPFWNRAGIGFQLGVQAMQSDFHESAFFTDDRSQFFITTGFFRRQMCERGWQWGIVYDHLNDESAEDFNVGQIRGELSYLFRGHELGVWFASGARDDQPGADSTTGVLSYETVDMYAVFYRRRMMNGGEGRFWAGFTSESDVIFGGDVRVPLACDWDLVAAFNYLAPQDDTTAAGQFAEAWNIGVNLVWYVCPEGALRAGQSRYRPLFNVADNGTLIVNTLQ